MIIISSTSNKNPVKMKTTVAVFLVALVVSVVPLIITTTEAKNKGPNDPPEGDLCIRICAGRPEPDHSICRETCALSERGFATLFERFACRDKCEAQPGAAPPAIKACVDGCTREYVAKAAAITDACNKSCDKASPGTYPPLIESCKQGCKAPDPPIN